MSHVTHTGAEKKEIIEAMKRGESLALIPGIYKLLTHLQSVKYPELHHPAGI